MFTPQAETFAHVCCSSALTGMAGFGIFSFPKASWQKSDAACQFALLWSLVLMCIFDPIFWCLGDVSNFKGAGLFTQSCPRAEPLKGIYSITPLGEFWPDMFCVFVDVLLFLGVVPCLCVCVAYCCLRGCGCGSGCALACALRCYYVLVRRLYYVCSSGMPVTGVSFLLVVSLLVRRIPMRNRWLLCLCASARPCACACVRVRDSSVGFAASK